MKDLSPARHRPVDAMKSPRFTGIGTFMRLPHLRDLTGVDAAVVGIPFDALGERKHIGRDVELQSHKGDICRHAGTECSV